MPEVGDKAPDFSLVNQKGETVSLKSLQGKKIVLYFYPKDDTPGCTKEACSLRDHFPQIQEKEGIVLGVSPDGPESHQKFIQKFDLPFDLLSDPDHKVMEAYDAWGEKNMYGKTSMGVKRSTYLIGEDGTILKVFKKVKTDVHGEEVLPFLG